MFAKDLSNKIFSGLSGLGNRNFSLYEKILDNKSILQTDTPGTAWLQPSGSSIKT